VLRVALTGGIATGKSYCLSRFAALGAATIDADALARDAVAVGSPGLAAVVAAFGQGILAEDGSLNRAALGRVVFTDSRARAALEAIVHPDVYRRIREWFANLPSPARVAIADIPLVFETGHNHDFDAVIVAACKPEEQLRRVMARDELSDSDARARIAAQ
jgi:dephospho-CoA kinase